jgi:hypothetical protein
MHALIRNLKFDNVIIWLLLSEITYYKVIPLSGTLCKNQIDKTSTILLEIL